MTAEINVKGTVLAGVIRGAGAQAPGANRDALLLRIGGELREAVELVASGTLAPALGEVMDLGQAARAHERLESGQSFGKLVLTA